MFTPNQSEAQETVQRQYLESILRCFLNESGDHNVFCILKTRFSYNREGK